MPLLAYLYDNAVKGIFSRFVASFLNPSIAIHRLLLLFPFTDNLLENLIAASLHIPAQPYQLLDWLDMLTDLSTADSSGDASLADPPLMTASSLLIGFLL